MPRTPDWQELTAFAISLAEASAKVIMPYFRANALVDVKDGPSWDPVTEGDRAGERAIRKLIEESYPNHGINGEEYGLKQSRSGFTWMLDPIDGTRAFVCGMPTWATLIGLTYEEKPVLGLMNQPFVGDLFYGNPEGAWLDHRGSTQPIHTRQKVSLAAAAVGTTAPELYRSESDKEALERLRRKVKMIRFGGDAYFYAVMAAGHLDIAMDANLHAHDIAPLLPIVSGAGGVYAEWNGGDPAKGGNVITAGSRPLLDEALAVLRG